MSEVRACPTCPNAIRGEIPDLRAVPVGLSVTDCVAGPDGSSTAVEIMAWFGAPDDEGEYPNEVATDSLVVPIDSDTATKAHRLAEEAPVTPRDKLRHLDSTDSVGAMRVKRAFCELVGPCVGPVDGACPALGEQAVQQVIDQTVHG